MKIAPLFFFIFIAFLIASCGDGGADDCQEASFSINGEIEAELNAFNNASVAWANNQTAENCSAWRDAGNRYLDAVEGLEDCAREVGQFELWQQNLTVARDALNNLPC